MKGIKDKDLGSLVRAAYEGINALELGFSDLLRYRIDPTTKDKEKYLD